VFDFAALFDWKLLACRGWMLAGSGGAGFGCGAARCVAGVEQAGKHGNFDHTGEQQKPPAQDGSTPKPQSAINPNSPLQPLYLGS